MIPMSTVDISQRIQYALDDLDQKKAAGLTLALKLEEHKRNIEDVNWQRGMQLHTLRVAKDALDREISQDADKLKSIVELGKRYKVDLSGLPSSGVAEWYMKWYLDQKTELDKARLTAKGGKGGAGMPDFADQLAYTKEQNDQLQELLKVDPRAAAILGDKSNLLEANDANLVKKLYTEPLTEEGWSGLLGKLTAERYFHIRQGEKGYGVGTLSAIQAQGMPFYMQQFPVVSLDDKEAKPGGAKLKAKWQAVDRELGTLPEQIAALQEKGQSTEYLEMKRAYLENWKYEMARRNDYYKTEAGIPPEYWSTTLGTGGLRSVPDLIIGAGLPEEAPGGERKPKGGIISQDEYDALVGKHGKVAVDALLAKKDIVVE
jgi:hypothetical protein